MDSHEPPATKPAAWNMLWRLLWLLALPARTISHAACSDAAYPFCFRFVADARAVRFDTLPPGLLTLSALTALHLNNCFAEEPPQAFGSLSQLQRLALEVWRAQQLHALGTASFSP